MKINVYIKNIKFKRDLNPFQKKKTGFTFSRIKIKKMSKLYNKIKYLII